MPLGSTETLTLRVKELPGVDGHVELADLSWCSVVCGPNNGGKTRLLRGLLVEKNLEVARVISPADLELFAAPFKSNQFAGNRFTNGQVPHNALEVATNLLSEQHHWYPSDIDDFVRTASKRYANNYGQLAAQDGTLLFGSTFRGLFTDTAQAKVFYLPPKRRLDAPGTLNEPARDAEIDSSKVLGQLFALKNAPLDDKRYARYRDVVKLFKQVTDADFDVALQSGSGASIFLRIRPPKSTAYRDSTEVGLGYQDALTICYCLTEPDVDVLIVEEAENHLHPDMQRKLLRTFVSGEYKKRVIVSTHSPTFLERPEKTKIFVCRTDREPSVYDTTNQAVALDAMGVSNLSPLTSDFILLVEGAGDVAAYRVLLDRLGIAQRVRISIVPLSGDNMNWFPLDTFRAAFQVRAIVDLDPGSKKQRDIFIKACQDKSIPIHQLERYAIENYFDADAYMRVFPEHIDKIPPKIAPKVAIEKQLSFTGRSWTESLAKLADAVDIDCITSSDLGATLVQFFPEVEAGT